MDPCRISIRVNFAEEKGEEKKNAKRSGEKEKHEAINNARTMVNSKSNIG